MSQDNPQMTTIRHAEARHMFKHDQVHWALFCLTTSHAHEIVDRPLSGTSELLHRGWAKEIRRYQEGNYSLRVIAITDAGHSELKRAIANAKADT